jgi:hypothetical protein
LAAERRLEACEGRFLLAVANYCLRDGSNPTFTASEIARADDEAIQAELWWIGGPAGVAALFNRCLGHRIGNVKLTRLGKRSAGIAWTWTSAE